MKPKTLIFSIFFLIMLGMFSFESFSSSDVENEILANTAQSVSIPNAGSLNLVGNENLTTISRDTNPNRRLLSNKQISNCFRCKQKNIKNPCECRRLKRSNCPTIADEIDSEHSIVIGTGGNITLSGTNGRIAAQETKVNNIRNNRSDSADIGLTMPCKDMIEFSIVFYVSVPCDTLDGLKDFLIDAYLFENNNEACKDDLNHSMSSTRSPIPRFVNNWPNTIKETDFVRECKDGKDSCYMEYQIDVELNNVNCFRLSNNTYHMVVELIEHPDENGHLFLGVYGPDTNHHSMLKLAKGASTFCSDSLVEETLIEFNSRTDHPAQHVAIVPIIFERKRKIITPGNINTFPPKDPIREEDGIK